MYLKHTLESPLLEMRKFNYKFLVFSIDMKWNAWSNNFKRMLGVDTNERVL